MSKDAEPAAPKKKGGKKKLIVMVVGGLVLVGGGVAGGMFAAGMGIGGAHAGPKVDPEKPKLVVRAGEEANPGDDFKDIGTFEPDARRYKPSYYDMAQAFTSNLRDTDGIAQVSLSVSTFYDSKVLDNFKDNEQPIRSAVLATLANQDAMVIETPEGKIQLQGRLKDAINKVLLDRTGYGGIDNVYFTNFIVQ